MHPDTPRVKSHLFKRESKHGQCQDPSEEVLVMIFRLQVMNYSILPSTVCVGIKRGANATHEQILAILHFIAHTGRQRNVPAPDLGSNLRIPETEPICIPTRLKSRATFSSVKQNTCRIA